jgi:flagellar motility protein MotE (MotC chaperone)
LAAPVFDRSETVSKKLIIITVAAGLVSFAGTFILGRLTKPAAAETQAVPEQTTPAQDQVLASLSQQKELEGTATSERAVTERQLKDLIYEVREKIEEYNDKLKGLETREERIQLAQTSLKKDIDELNNLHGQLVTTIANLKNERDRLEKSRVEIAQVEKTNLTSIAATYDRMDPVRAGEILTNMCTSQSQQGTTSTRTAGMDDAVKILHYMSERTKARVLGELVTAQPQLAAVLVQKLKQVTEAK